MIRPAIALTALLLAALPALAAPPVHKVGAVTWHAARYAGKEVTVQGYLLRQHKGYVLFSDEPGGKVSAHDLPVTGPGAEQIAAKRKYRLTGRFVKGGLAAANGNPFHLELTAPPLPLSGPAG